MSSIYLLPLRCLLSAFIWVLKSCFWLITIPIWALAWLVGCQIDTLVEKCSPVPAFSEFAFAAAALFLGKRRCLSGPGLYADAGGSQYIPGLDWRSTFGKYRMSDNDLNKIAERILAELNSGNVKRAVAVPHGFDNEIALFERVREANPDRAQEMLTYCRENHRCGWYLIDGWSQVISSIDDPEKVIAALMQVDPLWRYGVLDSLCERYPDLVSQIPQIGDPLDEISILIKIRGKTPEESTRIVADDVVQEFDEGILLKTFVRISNMLSPSSRFESFREVEFNRAKMATMRAQIAIAGALISRSSDLESVATALAAFHSEVATLILHGLDPETGAEILKNRAGACFILGSIGIDFPRTEAILTAMRKLGSEQVDSFFRGKEELFRLFKLVKLKVLDPRDKAFCLSIAHMPTPDVVTLLTAIDAKLPENVSYFYAWICHILRSEVPAFAAKAREVCGEIEKSAPDGSKLRRVISQIKERQQAGATPKFPPEEPNPDPEA
jgi:hypothetical protein